MNPEVIIAGAGPAGCAAAIALARRGRRVALLERTAVPQYKVCGDGLLPDAVRLLDGLGLGDSLRREGHELGRLAVFAPGGRQVSLEVPSLTLPRQRLHALLQEEACRCGAELRRGEVVGPLRAGEQVTGVRLRTAGGAEEPLAAPLVLLATGSNCTPLEAFDVCRRRTPSAVGIRAYFRDLSGRFADTMHISYDRLLGCGYGWVFPLPGGIYNIGCGRFLTSGHIELPQLQHLLETFIRRFPPAREIVAQNDPIGLPCGGVLRTGLSGAVPFAAGLLVAGEALGSTSPFTGEGIAKALQFGLLAAEVAETSLDAGDFSAPFLARYQTLCEERFRSVYRDLLRAQGWLGHPRRLNLLAWQAARKPRLRQALAGMLAGRVPPGELFSLAGLLGWVRDRQLTPEAAPGGGLDCRPETTGGEG